MIWLWIIGVIAIIAALTEALRRGGWWLSVAVFGVLPLILAGLWPRLGLEPTAFEYIKVFSVSWGALYISALRFRGLVRLSWARTVAFLILFVNILEAMVTETFSHTYINPVAGGFLLLSQALPRLMRVEENDPQQDLRYDLGLDWVLAYTLWNFTFIYGTGPAGEPPGEWSAFALTHLIVPLLLMRGDAGRYIQFRAYALSLLMMLAVTLPEPPYLMFTPEWHHPAIAAALRFTSLALAAFVLLRSLRRPTADGGAAGLVGLLFPNR